MFSHTEFLMILYFIILITCNFRNMYSNVAKGVYFKQPKHRNIFLAVLLSFYPIILWKFFQQSLQATLHFRSCKYRSHPLFKWRDTHFLWARKAYFAVFQLKNTRKASQTLCLWWVTTPAWAWKSFEPKLTSAVAYCRVYWVFISCIKAVFTTWEVAHTGQFVWTNKDR